MKVRAPSRAAVLAARRVLELADVREPRDIHVEAIAARHGAMVLYGRMPTTPTARAHIVRAGAHAVVRLDERVRGTPVARFTVAHELGHHVLHETVDHVLQCAGEARRRGAAWQVEREANDFATELLVPAALGAPYAAAPKPSLAHVDALARRFRTSLEMSAIRFAELSPAPCAAVLSHAGIVVWSAESAAFPWKIPRRLALGAPTAAARLLTMPEGTYGEDVIEGAGWRVRGPVVEHALRVPGEGGVLSWLVPHA